MIPLHPVTTEDPATLTWVTPVAATLGNGHVRRAPGALQALLDDGTLARVELAGNGVRTTLAAGTWREAGPRVRTALHAALGADGWCTADDDAPTGAAADRTDAELARIAGEVLTTDVAPYAATHGGSIDIVAVHGGVVEVTLRGACSGCPAAALTLHARFEGLLRRRWPALVAVRPRAPQRRFGAVIDMTSRTVSSCSAVTSPRSR